MLCVQAIVQHYKLRTVGEAPLQSLQLPRKIPMIRESQLSTRK